MGEDWLLDVVDAVDRAGRNACDQLGLALGELERLRAGRVRGTPLAELVTDTIRGGGRGVRVQAAEAFTEYEQAVAVMRGAIVCSLVDDSGLTFSEVAMRFGISRQAAARLYKSAKNLG
ncbi:MAG: hypothetical protein QOG64_1199 [Acidimicrobiaceae bacterium]|nr:hypothetical protein [Acidimicrobiaceae bacterium]